MTEATETSSANIQLQSEPANVQLQTEHVNGQLISTTFADGQSANIQLQIEPANTQLQTEHVNGQLIQTTSAKGQSANNQLQTESIDWPNNVIEIIREVMNIPCNTPNSPEFIFKFSESAASHNLEILNKYSNNLGKALRANKNSPLGCGSEFRTPQELKKVFRFHPLWSQMKSFLSMVL